MTTFAFAPAQPQHGQSRTAAVRPPRHPLGALSDASPSAPVLQRSHVGCACGGSCPECQEDDSHRIQTALHLGASGDIYEREADRVAEYVMRMTEPERSDEPQVTPLNHSAQPNRRCTTRSSEEGARESETATDSRDAADDDQAGSHTTSGVLARVEAMSGGGQPLEQSVRGFFESRFGRGLSRVRVDTSAAAAGAARELNAKAFTMGSYIAFASSQYAPGSARGDRLLAHELTHTIQQEPRGTIQRSCLSDESDDYRMGVIRPVTPDLNPYSSCVNGSTSHSETNGGGAPESPKVPDLAVKAIIKTTELPFEVSEHVAEHMMAHSLATTLKAYSRTLGAIGLAIEVGIALRNEGVAGAAKELLVAGPALGISALAGPPGVVAGAFMNFVLKPLIVDPLGESLERRVGLPSRDQEREEFARRYPNTTAKDEARSRAEKYVKLVGAMNREMLEALSEHVQRLNSELQQLRAEGWRVDRADLSDARQYRLARQLEAIRSKYSRLLRMNQ